MPKFEIVSKYKPKGDQPKVIDQLTKGLNDGKKFQTLLGVTGSGKTFTVANVIEKVQKPTLVIAHNKTLAAQLSAELREFFPNNAVGYFVSYYDYYQPEAYMPSTDTYIEKDASINDEINKYRHLSTSSLLTRNDVIVVASVSCIYGLGSPDRYKALMIKVKVGEEVKRDLFLRKLTDIQYQRSKSDFKQGMFSVLGDVLEIYPPGMDSVYRIEFFGDEIERIVMTDPWTGEIQEEFEEVHLFPAKHDVASQDVIDRAIIEIKKDLEIQHAKLTAQGRMLEAHRIRTRTEYDIEMMQELGYCSGIENYTRYLNGGKPGDPPGTLIDYFPDDFLMVIDESHITVPQIGAMYNGNLSRKKTLVEHGFRLPSAQDNRPLQFEEFEKKMHQTILVSATPSKYEYANTKKEDIAEQIIRPTGLTDPTVVVRPKKNQIDDIFSMIDERTKMGDRTLITTLTKKSAEDLTEYLTEHGIRVKYLHSDIDTLERIEILRDLRLGKFDVLVGINLLREGLDLPEVSLILILDADKQGFLRSTPALIQTIGRAARNVEGLVILYADKMTPAMEGAMSETDRRRAIQEAYNEKHGIKPQTIIKAVRDIEMQRRKTQSSDIKHYDKNKVKSDELEKLIEHLEHQMDLAAQNMQFEKAAELRDEIEDLSEGLK